MKNIYSILLDEFEKGIPLAIATIVETKGSTPQVQGSSAIFSSAGLISGTLGGGILEAKAQVNAIEAIRHKSSVIFEADMDSGISDQESAICGGKAIILIDAIPEKHIEVFLDLTTSLKNNLPGTLITKFQRTSGGQTEIRRDWIKDGKELMSFNEKRGGSAIFIEPVRPLPRLIIAGAGHVGQAVTHISSLLGFEVTVIDDRQEFCNKEKLPDADHLIVDDFAGVVSNIPVTGETYIVIVTRGHTHDSEILRQCIGSGAAYIGMIGSRRKIRLMRQKFVDEGWVTPEQFDRVHAPIGIEIGSQTVQEIAVSICAQLVQVRSQKAGQKHKPSISAVILAAGESTRMGKNKLLLPYGDKTIIEAIIQTIMQSEVKNIIIVVGSEKEKIREQISKYPVTIAENHDYRSGMLSSIKCGLRANPEDADAVMILLGDQPMINGLIIDQLTDTFRHTDKGIIIAVHKGKRGHPILINIKYKTDIEKLGSENSMHDFTRKFASDILEVETDKSDILRDIDTPEDYNNEIKYRRLS